ncbi:MAG: oligosaccharide flippase family protein [Bryobacteraceae bacterium]
MVTTPIAANYVLLSAGEFVAKLLAVLAFTHLGRVLGPNHYGSLEFGLAALIFFSLPVDLGLGTYGAREIARNPGSISSLMSEISALRFLLACISFTVLLLLLAVSPETSQSKPLLALLGLSLFFAPALLQWVFQGQDQMHWVAWASIIRQTVFAGFVVLFVRSDQSILLAAAAECVAVLCTALFCLIVANTRMNLALQLPRWSPKALLLHLRESSPIGLSEFCWAALWYSPTVALGLFVSDRSLGWFGASHRCLTSLHSFVYLYFFNLLPAFSRCASQPNDQFVTLVRSSLGGVAWAGLFVALLGTLLSGEIMRLLYGPAFGEGAVVFSLLVWVIPVTLIGGISATL